MTTAAIRQENEPASPEITEVGPNVLRMQLDIALPGLSHVNCYAIIDDDGGVALVDPGLPGKPSWQSLLTRMKDASLDMKLVHSIFITHSHPDHFGNAERIALQTGAAVITHRAFRTIGSDHNCTMDDCDDPDHAHPDVDQAPLPETIFSVRDKPSPWSGVKWDPSADNPELRKHQTLELAGRGWPLPTPDRRVSNNEEVKMGGRMWKMIHTPGHTVDHLCLWEPESGVFMSGDHVLPTITPHISGMGSGPDPLASFFVSLDHVAALPHVTTALPAHGHPFPELAKRCQEIKDHHQGRTVRLVEASEAEGPTTVETLSHHLFRQERWGAMAESETYAHLEHLRLLGKATRSYDDGDKMIYDVHEAI